MRLPRHRRAARGQTLTPLIDMIFLLLLFFLIESEFVAFGHIELAPPRGGGGVEGAALPAIIRLTRDGQVDWDGRIMSPTALRQAAGAALARNGEQAFVVMPMGDTQIQAVVTAMDILAAAGAERLTLERDIFDIDLADF